MTLDITKIAAQIGEMADKIKTGSRESQEHLKTALVKMNDGAVNLAALKLKINNAKFPWPVAHLYESLNAVYPPPGAPPEYTALATDGSNIDVDRHKAAHCYLINIGSVCLHYGKQPEAELESVPFLYSDESELVIKDESNSRREQQIEGALLDARRAVEECRFLAQIATAQPVGSSTMAMMDGSLVMFGLESFPDFVQNKLLNEGLLKALDQLKEIAGRQKLCLASYISMPRSADVVNALKIAICPQEQVDCERSCSAGEAACDVISGLTDRMIFAGLLKPGERSALFINPSHILERYGPHQVFFFYLRLDDEIARVEVPLWVAANPERLDLTHALVLDQCRRGQDYPVALSEAHEQAVVTGADREEFWSLVDEYLVDQKLPTYTSIKSRSKRTRWL